MKSALLIKPRFKQIIGSMILLWAHGDTDNYLPEVLLEKYIEIQNSIIAASDDYDRVLKASENRYAALELFSIYTVRKN